MDEKCENCEFFETNGHWKWCNLDDVFIDGEACDGFIEKIVMDKKITYKDAGCGLLFKGNLKEVKKIVVHNAVSSQGAEKVAQMNYFETMSKKREAFAHYYVDDEQVVRLARDTWKAYHTGKKEWNDTTIGIEICVNPMGCLNECANNQCVSGCKRFKTMRERFYKAEQNAIDLIYILLAKWSLTENDIVFHSDLKATGCPFFTKKLHKLSKAKDFLTIFAPKVD